MQAQTAARGREYETIYILRPDIPSTNAQKVSERVREVIDREGGKLTQVETWGRRSLAYVVKKRRRGVYVYVKYLGGGRAVSELERNLRMLDDVLRYQTVQVRDDVDLGSVTVAPDAVEFEAIEPAPEGDEEVSRARLLGLDVMPSTRSSGEWAGNRERAPEPVEAEAAPEDGGAAEASDANEETES